MRKKSIVLAFMLMLALPISTLAQGGAFQRGGTNESNHNCDNADEPAGLFGNRGVQTTGVIDNQTFGQEVSLGGGIIVLLAAGAGYAAFRRKEERQ